MTKTAAEVVEVVVPALMPVAGVWIDAGDGIEAGEEVAA